MSSFFFESFHTYTTKNTKDTQWFTKRPEKQQIQSIKYRIASFLAMT